MCAQSNKKELSDKALFKARKIRKINPSRVVFAVIVATIVKVESCW